MPSRGRQRQSQPQQMAGWPPNAFGVAHVVDASGALVPAYVVHGGPGGAAYLMPAGAFLISFYFSFLSLDDASAKRKEKTLLRRLAASVCSFSSFRSPGRVGRGL